MATWREDCKCRQLGVRTSEDELIMLDKIERILTKDFVAQGMSQERAAALAARARQLRVQHGPV